MPMTVSGMLEVDAMIARVDTTAKKRVTVKLYARAVAIQQLAIKFAPIDHGNLEKAIKVRPENPGRVRDEITGQFTRQEIEVYIDMGMPIPGRPGKTIGDYAYEMHELLQPYGHGHYQLGDKSKEKGGDVGGKFLERAMQHYADGLIQELAMDMLDG